MKHTRAVFSAATLGIALLATPTLAKDLTFGIIPNAMEYPYDVALVKGFQDAADKAGVKVDVLDPKSSVETQANQIDDLLQQNVDGIAFMPNDSVVAMTFVDTVAAKKVPIVASAVPVGDTTKEAANYVYPKLTALVTTDDVAAGTVAGELAATLLPKDREAKIAVVEGAPGFAVVKQRETGFEDALKKAGVKFTIVASQPTDWTPTKGESVCQNILTANPDVDLIFSHADDMAIGCARAISAGGSKAILLATGGGSKLGNEAIKTGDIKASVCTSPTIIGELSFKALFDAVSNPSQAKTGQYITYPLVPITKDTLDKCIGGNW